MRSLKHSKSSYLCLSSVPADYLQSALELLSRSSIKLSATCQLINNTTAAATARLEEIKTYILSNRCTLLTPEGG